MKKFKTILLAAMVLGTFLTSGRAMAGITDSAEASFTFELPNVISMFWCPMSNGKTISLTGANELTPGEIITGYRQDIAGGSLIVSANTSWELAASADDQYFYSTNADKPVSDLAIATQYSAGSYTSLNGTSQVSVLTGMPRGEYIPVTLSYKLNVSNNDEADVYSTLITYTVLPL